MKVTVLGATGNIGQRVVKLLLADGHRVTAFVHGNAPFEANDNLTIMQGDIHSRQDVQKAVQGCDVLLSALGSWHTPTKDILSSGMRAAVPAMEQQQGKRLISLTGSDAILPGEKVSLVSRLTHFMFSKIAPAIMRDSEEHLKLLQDSSLEWTVLRSPVMSDKPYQGFTVNKHKPLLWEKVPRDAVAHALVAQLTATDYIRQAPHVHASRG